MQQLEKEAKAEAARLVAEIKNFKEMQDKSSASSEDLRAQVENLKILLAAEHKKVQSLHDLNEIQQAKMKEYRAELQRAIDTKEALEAKALEAAQLLEKFAVHERTAADLKDELDKMRTEEKKNLEEIRRLSEANGKERDTIAEIQASKKCLEEEVSRLKVDASKAEQEIANLKKNGPASSDKELQALRSTNVRLENERKELLVQANKSKVIASCLFV